MASEASSAGFRVSGQPQESKAKQKAVRQLLYPKVVKATIDDIQKLKLISEGDDDEFIYKDPLTSLQDGAMRITNSIISKNSELRQFNNDYTVSAEKTSVRDASWNTLRFKASYTYTGYHLKYERREVVAKVSAEKYRSCLGSEWRGWSLALV